MNLGVMQKGLSTSLMKGSEFLAGQTLSIGQGTFHFLANLFVMLYLLFFLLRNEAALFTRTKGAIPLPRSRATWS